MALTPLQLQIFITLGVILGVALIALVFDLLRGNNEQLRERVDLLTTELAGQKGARIARAAQQTLAGIEDTTAAAQPPLADEAARRDMYRGASIASRLHHRAGPQNEGVSTSRNKIATMRVRDTAKPAAARSTTAFELKRVANGSPVFAIEGRAPPEPKRRAHTVGSWDLVDPVIRKRLKELDEAERDLADEEIVPSGIADRKALERLLAADKSVSGAVIAIGITDATNEMRSTVTDFLSSRAHENCFVCQSGENEFLLVHPTDNPAAARRKLNQISETLWNFQLQSFASSPRMFSWGGLEVQDEPLSEAVASARDRLYQTQRIRNATSLGFASRQGHSTP